MIEVNSTEFFVMALTVAVALVALLFGHGHKEEATTLITAFSLNPSVTHDDGLVVMQANDDGSVLVLRNAIPLEQGDSVNLVVTAVGDKLTLVEKKGVQAHSAIELVADATTLIPHLTADRFHVRYESEITGQWALFSFTNRDSRSASAHLKL